MRSLIPILILALLPLVAMAQTQGVVYPNGVATVTVPSGQYVSVFTEGQGVATVKKNVGGPSTNLPEMYALETNGLVTNGQVVFGPYTTGITLKIYAKADKVRYSVSALSVNLPCLVATPQLAQTQLAPTTVATTATALSSDLLSGLVIYTNTSGATETYTLPTGTLLDAAASLGINQAFQWSLINTSSTANTITLAAGTGHTIVGDVITQGQSQATGGNASRWLTRKTAANTFITYRIN